MTTDFQNALKSGDVRALRAFPKSDLHNHAFAGGHRALVSEWAGRDIAPLDRPLASMAEMGAWVEDLLGSVFSGPKGRLRAFEAAFVQAKYDGVTRLEIGEDVWAITLFDQDASKLTRELVAAHECVAPDIEWLPQLGLSRHCSISALTRWLAPFLELRTYRTIDLSGNEFAQPIERFRPLYRIARNSGLRLKGACG
jgi:adenosine deaminase